MNQPHNQLSLIFSTEQSARSQTTFAERWDSLMNVSIISSNSDPSLRRLMAAVDVGRIPAPPEPLPNGSESLGRVKKENKETRLSK